MAIYTFVMQLLAAFFAVSIISFLYKDNPAFKLAEHTLLGLMMGVTLYAAYESITKTVIFPLINGKVFILLPLILGLMVYTQFSKNYKWVSFFPLAILMGVGIGLSIRGAATGQFMKQILSTMRPIDNTQSIVKNIEILIMLVGTVSSLSYFIFTYEHKGKLNYMTKIGRCFIMIAMGAQFGGLSTTFLNYSIPVVTKAVTFPGYFFLAVLIIYIIFDIFTKRKVSL